MSTATRRPAGVVRRPGLLAGVMIAISALVLLIAICTGSVGTMVVGGIMLLACVVWGLSRIHRTRVLMAWVAFAAPISALLWSLIF